VTDRQTDHTTRSFTINGIYLRIKGKEMKEKEKYLYSVICILCISQSAHFYLQIHHACCFSFVSVHQMAPPLTEVGDIQLQLNTHLLTPKG